MKKGIYYDPETLEMIELIRKASSKFYYIMTICELTDYTSYQSTTFHKKEELKNFKYLDEV